jgi:hypothetical protein
VYLELLEDRTLLSGTSQLLQSYGLLPLSFEANQGQTASQVNFLSRGTGYSLFLTPSQAVLALQKAASTASVGPLKPAPEQVLAMQFVGANSAAQAAGLDQQTGVSNYFVGSDPSKWLHNVPHYGQVEYQSLYRGIDLVYYGNQTQLEYDFVVAPGANPGAIQLAFQGMQSQTLDSQGDLVLHTAGGDVLEQAPVVYQEIGGVRHFISGKYVLEANGQVGFSLGAYDHSQSLVIDPVLSYSTYLGGSGTDTGSRIAVDSTGSAYVFGTTDSTDFPVLPNALAEGLTGYWPFDGDGVEQSGSGRDLQLVGGVGFAPGLIGQALDLHANNAQYAQRSQDDSVYDFGSNDFTIQVWVNFNSHNREQTLLEKFAGSGGPGWTLTTPGSHYQFTSDLTGPINSPDILTTGTWHDVLVRRSGDEFDLWVDDALVAKTTASGAIGTTTNPLLVGRRNAGDGRDFSVDGHLDETAIWNRALTDAEIGALWNKGKGLAINGTLTGVFQSANAGKHDFYVAKLNPAGTGLIYSTYLGGSGDEVIAGGLALDAAGNAYLTGETKSADFPTTFGAFQPTFAGDDAFLTKLNAAGNDLDYSTFINGNGSTIGEGVAVDAMGNAYFTGETHANNLPTTPGAAQKNFGGGGEDAFVGKLNPTGSALVYLTYLGGSGSEDSGEPDSTIAIDGTGNAYVSGMTQSTDFPTTTGAFQTSLVGTEDAFVTKLNTTGTAFTYSTYLGGTGINYSTGIAVDSAGNAYIAGTTNSTNFPTMNPLQATNGGGFDDFISKLNPTGTGLVWSTYLGGSGDENTIYGSGGGPSSGVGSIALDSFDNVFVSGSTNSINFPGIPPVPPFGYGGGAHDGYMAVIDGSGTKLLFSTYLGGSGDDWANGIAVDSAGNAYVTGNTSSPNFLTTPGALQTSFGGGTSDAFVVRIGNPLPVPVPAPSGIVSWWPANGNAKDIVGPNNGKLNNGVTYVAGEVASAFGFDTTDYVSAPTVGLPTGNSDRTIEMWVKGNSFPTSGEAFFAGYGNFGSNAQTYHLGTTGSKLLWSQWGQALTGPALNANQWYHVAVTNVGDLVTLYLDGAPVASGTFTINTPAGTTFYMGRIPGSLGDIRKLNGSVDEVSVYNRALTPAEILAIFQAGSAGKVLNGIQLSPKSLPDATIGVAYSQTISAGGGTAPYTFGVTSGALPGGLNLSTSGALSGTPTATGSFTFTVTATDAKKETGSESYVMDVSTASPADIVFSDAPRTTTAGKAFTSVVKVEDAFGDIITDYAGTVHFTSSDPQASLPSNYTFTSSDHGMHSFGFTFKTAGSQSILATDDSVPPLTGSSSDIDVTAASAAGAVFSPVPPTTTIGNAFDMAVLIEDAFGNIADSYQGTIHFTSSDLKAVLPADYTFTSKDQGLHSFSFTLKTAGTQSITTSDTATSITGSATGINVRAPIVFSDVPTTTKAGSAFTLNVKVEDAFGNTDTGYTGTVHFTSSDPQAVLPADYTFTTADQGVHSFTFKLYKAGGQSVAATDTVKSNITGTSFGIVVGTSAVLQPVLVQENFVVNPDYTISGQKFDASGNPTGSPYQVARGSLKSITVGRDPNGNLVLFGIDPYKGWVWELQFYANGSPVSNHFTNVWNLGPVESIALGSTYNGNLELFAVDPYSHLTWAMKFDATDAKVSGFAKITHAGLATTLTIGHDAKNNPLVFTVDRYFSQVQELKFDFNGNPVGDYFRPGSSFAVKSIAVGNDSQGNPEVFAVDPYFNHVFYLNLDADSNPASPFFRQASEGIIAQSIAVGHDVNNNPLLFAITPNYKVSVLQFDGSGKPIKDFKSTGASNIRITSLQIGYGRNGFLDLFGLGLGNNQVFLETFDGSGNTLQTFFQVAPGEVIGLTVSG